MNQKYEITGITHKKYPFEPGDDAWVYDNAIVAGNGRTDKGTMLKVRAIVCDHGYAFHGLRAVRPLLCIQESDGQGAYPGQRL